MSVYAHLILYQEHGYYMFRLSKADIIRLQQDLVKGRCTTDTIFCIKDIIFYISVKGRYIKDSICYTRWFKYDRDKL